MAMNDLKVMVPGLESAQAFEISPGDVRVLARERVPGGIRISVPDFGVTSLILVTTDDAVADRIQTAIARVRPLACQLAIEQAEHQLQSVSDIIGRLREDGHRLFDPDDPKNPPLQPGVPAPNDEADLLAKSEEMIKAAREALEREDYPLAWSEARRAGRPLRILMCAHWEKANEALVKTLNPPEDDSELQARRRARLDSKKEEPRPPDYKVVSEPVCSPPLVSSDTLPQHYIWLDWLRTGTFGRNLVPTGSFEDTESLEASGWIDMSHHFEGITSKIWVVRDRGRDQDVLKMRVDPKDPSKIDDLPPVLDFPAAAIRSPSVRVKAGQFLRISVLVRKANPTPPGAGGLIIARLDRRRDAPVPLARRIPQVQESGPLPPRALRRRVHGDPRPGRLRRGLLRRPPGRGGRAIRRGPPLRPGGPPAAPTPRVCPRPLDRHPPPSARHPLEPVSVPRG